VSDQDGPALAGLITEVTTVPVGTTFPVGTPAPAGPGLSAGDAVPQTIPSSSPGTSGYASVMVIGPTAVDFRKTPTHECATSATWSGTL
jgi:hypothetical protein